MAGKPSRARTLLVAELDGVTNRSLRLLRAARVIQETLAEAGVSVVVVGGSAITAYDPDAYTSLDIDFVGPALHAQLDAVLCDQLELRIDGRHWVDEELAVLVELPSRVLEPEGAEVVIVQIESVGDLRVIAIEDLILDRLHSWAATGHYDSWAQAARLIENPTTDPSRLARRAHESGLTVTCDFAGWLSEEAGAGRHEPVEVKVPIARATSRTTLDELIAEATALRTVPSD